MRPELAAVFERATALLEQGDPHAYDEFLLRELRPSLERLRGELNEADGAFWVLTMLRAGLDGSGDPGSGVVGPADGSPEAASVKPKRQRAPVRRRQISAAELKWFRRLSAREAALVVMLDAPERGWTSAEVWAEAKRRGHRTAKINIGNSLGRAAAPTAKPAPLVVRTGDLFRLTAAGREFARRLVEARGDVA